MTWSNPGNMDPDGLPDWIGIWQPKWCNCKIWAAYMQSNYGGYVCHRVSLIGWKWRRNGIVRTAFWHHSLWTLDRKLYWEYSTLAAKPDYLMWYQLPRMLLFRGRASPVTRRTV